MGAAAVAAAVGCGDRSPSGVGADGSPEEYDDGGVDADGGQDVVQDGGQEGQSMASSVSQYGITWHFDREYQVGRYANEDWWVLGPVTITGITPESQQVDSRWINGTEVNPSSVSHGYDSSTLTYNHTLNVAPSIRGPLTLETGSVVSGLSGEAASGSGPALDEIAILTVVSSAPPLGAFRPHPYGTDKTSYWTESQVDYGILQSLPAVGSPPDLAAAAAQQFRFWNEQSGASWQQNGTKARNAQGGGYGRDVAKVLGDRALALHLNYTNQEKRDLFIAVIQYGSDIYGRRLVGGTWSSDGGINHGRKMPLVLAGLALNDSDILYEANRDRGNNIFQEDGSTFYVTQGDINLSNYSQSYLGLPDWSTRYWQHYDLSTNSSATLSGENGGCSGSYRYVGAQYAPHALAMRLTPGAVDAWNWPAFFDYTDRFMTLDCHPVGGTNGVSHFAQAMWNAYRSHHTISE